jgi:hypothetical protein
MKKATPKAGRSLFDMPVEDRPMIYTQREPFSAKRIAKQAGVLGKGKKAVPAGKMKAPAKPKRSRRLNGLR